MAPKRNHDLFLLLLELGLEFLIERAHLSSHDELDDDRRISFTVEEEAPHTKAGAVEETAGCCIV
jgi:hypothetical protein